MGRRSPDRRERSAFRTGTAARSTVARPSWWTCRRRRAVVDAVVVGATVVFGSGGRLAIATRSPQSFPTMISRSARAGLVGTGLHRVAGAEVRRRGERLARLVAVPADLGEGIVAPVAVSAVPTPWNPCATRPSSTSVPHSAWPEPLTTRTVISSGGDGDRQRCGGVRERPQPVEHRVRVRLLGHDHLRAAARRADDRQRQHLDARRVEVAERVDERLDVVPVEVLVLRQRVGDVVEQRDRRGGIPGAARRSRRRRGCAGSTAGAGCG